MTACHLHPRILWHGANCSAILILAETGELPSSNLTAEETVGIYGPDDVKLLSVVIRQHDLVDLGFSDPPFDRHRIIGHRMHLDVSDAGVAAAVKTYLPVGARVKVEASVPLPALIVESVQDPATIRMGDRTIKRREVLFRPA